VQVNEGVRSQENSNRLEWLQESVILEGLEEVTNQYILILRLTQKLFFAPF